MIEMHDVSIRYITGDYRDIGLKDYFVKKFKGQYVVSEFWAVDGVACEIERGDFVGIIGSNGAGKSTLLKAISGIMRPEKGFVAVNGAVSALLNLGSGFDGDLTVRENTFLRGAMLGYTKRFMQDTYEDIIAFSELGDFQERPYKQLSSGMKSRLAFSIACLVDPDILILDEVLSVGDGAFRKKSEQRMLKIIGSGATTILVSHSIEQIKSLCNKALWLEKGKQVDFGPVRDVCARYERFLENKY